MEQDNKRIAKNTMFLYMRLLVTIIVGLFTSRIVLNSLGFVDYGINNVVGGIVMMVAFLNVGMSGASQRFLSYDLGKNDFESLKKTFSTSLWTHISIAVIAFILMESIGTWFVNTKLNIPDARMFAANWVFQCSILVFVVSVISVPYNSCIIAHERMGMYAYISIYEVIAKLVIALLIKFSPTDKLVLYSSLLLLTQISINVIYVVYCKRHFNECVLLRKLDVVLFKEMFAFAGWGCVGNTGFTMKDQGSNIILNLFGGTTVNAARGIAAQVNTIVSSFASNFTMAMNPQVTKLYASGEYDKSRVLAFAGSKYAFLLLSIIVIPFLTNEHYLLTLWLGDIPEYTDMFVCIALICSLIYSLSYSTPQN
jgi:O-antigen/teichoic acid export membrane protein